MKIQKITKNFLVVNDACEEGIKFFQINRLEGFPVSLVNDIKGDYDGFVAFIMNRINNDYKFDERDNIVWSKDRYGWESEYEYDEISNRIYEKNSNESGYVWEYEYDDKGSIIFAFDKNLSIEYRWEYRYDENGNVIWMKDFDGIETECKYDENGNEILKIVSTGHQYRWDYRYDERGNITFKNDYIGNTYKYEVEYYDDGQLKRYGKLYIPWFEKN